MAIQRAMTNREAFFDMFKNLDLHSILPDSRYPYINDYMKRERDLERARRQAPDYGENAIHRVPKVDESEVIADFEAMLLDEMIASTQGADYSRKAISPQQIKGMDDIKYDLQKKYANNYEILSKLKKEKTLNSEQQREVDEMKDSLLKDIEEWEKDYGQNLFKDIPLRVNTFQVNSERGPTMYEPKPIDQRRNLKMIDDKLLKQIFDHIKDPQLRVPRISDMVVTG